MWISCLVVQELSQKLFFIYCLLLLLYRGSLKVGRFFIDNVDLLYPFELFKMCTLIAFKLLLSSYVHNDLKGVFRL